MSDCKHERQLFINGKVSDMCQMYLTHPSSDGMEHVGYPLAGLGVGNGDYIEIRICISCKQVLGLSSEEKIIQIMTDAQSEFS